MAKSLKVLVVDDSALYRSILAQVLNAQPDVEVVAKAADGMSALAQVERYHPDLVTLDVEMPVLNGIDTLKRLRRDFSDVIVIMCSAVTAEGADVTLRCLSMGARDFITKPNSGTSSTESKQEIEAQLIPILASLQLSKKAANPRVSMHETVHSPGEPALASRPPSPAKIISRVAPQIVTIGCSTGGPVALQHIIPLLPADFPLPVVIVQHMPPLFTQRLASSLNEKSPLNVVEAKNGQRLQAGHVYIAPGGQQMKVQRGINLSTSSIVITDDPPERHCKPSVNYLFRSLAEVYQGAVLASILTGMGDDGTLGLRRLKRFGAQVFAQDEASCTVFGMPKEAINAEVVDKILPLTEIAKTICATVMERK